MTPQEKARQQALAQIEQWNQGGYSQAAPYRYAAFVPPRQKVQPKRGRGGTLTSLISEAGGAGGAVGGAAIGTALLPGVGTLAGAILGGFLGGTSGRVVENKVRDDRIGLGDALKEGAMSGAFSGAGTAFQLSKAAKGAKALQGAMGAEKVAMQAPRTGMLEQKGLNLTSKAGGYFTGATATGSQPLTPSKVKAYDELLRKLKIPANDANDLATHVENRLNTVWGTIDKSLTSGNKPIPKAEIKSFGNNFIKQVQDAPGLSQTGTKFAQEQATKLSNVKDAKGLVQFRRDLDKFINFNQNPDSAMAERQGVARILRDSIKNKTNNLVPGLKQQNNLAHDLSDIQGYVLKAANRGNVEATNAGGGLVGRVMTSPTANTLKAKAGNQLQTLGRGTAGTATGPVSGPASQVLRQAKIQAPGNILEAASTPPLQNEQPNVDPATGEPLQAPDESFNIQAGVMPEQDMGTDPMQAQNAPTATSLQDALMQAQQLLGTGQTPATYLSYAKALMSGNKPNANQQKTSMALQNARNVVDELTQAYKEVGGPQGAGTGQVRNVLGRARIDQQARNYNDLRQAFLSRIARAFGEVGTLNEGDINRALGAIPDLADNQQTAARKLAILNNLLAKAQQNNTGGSADLTDALTQLQSAY